MSFDIGNPLRVSYYLSHWREQNQFIKDTQDSTEIISDDDDLMLNDVNDGSYDSSDDNLEDIPEEDLNIDSDNENVDRGSQPIFPGASISIGSFMLLLAIFVQNIISQAIGFSSY